MSLLRTGLHFYCYKKSIACTFITNVDLLCRLVLEVTLSFAFKSRKRERLWFLFFAYSYIDRWTSFFPISVLGCFNWCSLDIDDRCGNLGTLYDFSRLPCLSDTVFITRLSMIKSWQSSSTFQGCTLMLYHLLLPCIKSNELINNILILSKSDRSVLPQPQNNHNQLWNHN